MNLLVRTPNWLGDIVMALPAIETIREHFAKASLTLAAPAGFAALCATIPGVDDVIPLPGGSTWRTWRAQRDAIRAHQIDLAILLTNSFGSAWVLARAGVPERWGYRTDLRGRLLTRAVERPRPQGAERRRLKAGADRLARPNARHRVHAVMTTPHHSHYYLALTDALGMAPVPSMSPLRVSDDAVARARGLLTERGGRDGQRLVGVAPGAAYGQAKRWLPESVADVLIRLAKVGIVPVLVGAAGDRPAARAIESALVARGSAGVIDRIDLVGDTDLPTLMGVLASCEVVLSNDSGAMHLASAVGRPVVAVFGPTNEEATSPLGPHRIIHTEAWCRPCMLRECPIDHRCMRDIAPETVFEHVMTWIQRAPGASAGVPS
jgi:heptosyltransferase-2